MPGGIGRGKIRCLVIEDEADTARYISNGLSTGYLFFTRCARASSPVLVLSALASLDERVKGLRGGGDDYLIKPFAFSELLARVQALQFQAAHYQMVMCLKACL